MEWDIKWSRHQHHTKEPHIKLSTAFNVELDAGKALKQFKSTQKKVLPKQYSYIAFILHLKTLLISLPLIKHSIRAPFQNMSSEAGVRGWGAATYTAICVYGLVFVGVIGTILVMPICEYYIFDERPWKHPSWVPNVITKDACLMVFYPVFYRLRAFLLWPLAALYCVTLKPFVKFITTPETTCCGMSFMFSKIRETTDIEMGSLEPATLDEENLLNDTSKSRTIHPPSQPSPVRTPTADSTIGPPPTYKP